VLATTVWVAVFGLLTHFAFEHLHQISHFYSAYRYWIWAMAAITFIVMIYAVLKHRHTQR
nr:DedA family protein [Vibrio anguillarum]